MKLMYDNITVATEEKQDGKRIFRLVENLHSFFKPEGIFINDSQTVDMEELRAWVRYRIPPTNRGNIKELLSRWGIKKYDSLEIAFKTRASVMGDGWWIKIKETDTFRKDTIRGKAGYPEIDLEDFLKQTES